MGLEFIDQVKDQRGCAIYCLHDGSGYEERRMNEFARQLERHTRKQIVVFDGKSEDGRELADFYDVMDFPCVMIVRDNDEIHQIWKGRDLPPVDQVAMLAEQAG